MLAFIHIPKTAGSTISTILRHCFGTNHCDIRLGDNFQVPPLTARVLRRTHCIYWRLRSIAGHGVVPYSDLHVFDPEIKYYTFLRNPLVRCASEYQYLVRRDGLRLSFNDWIETDVVRNRMTKKLCGREDAGSAIAVLQHDVGFVGLVERFNESLILWRDWIGDPNLDIRYRPKNVMSGDSIKKRLLGNPDSREKLARANQEDIKVYEYVRQAIYARQADQYGSDLSADVQQFESGNRRPRPYPRQLPSLLLRELVYKPLAPRLARP